MSAFFFALVSLAQLFTYNFKMMATFLLSLKFIVTAIHQYSENKFKECCNSLVLASVVIALCEVAFIWMPFSVETGYRLAL